MADVRVIAALALAACSSASPEDRGPGEPAIEPARPGAQTEQHSGVAPPAGWHALPEVAAAARTAAGATGVTVDGAEAWGETAMGCYAVWLAMHGGDAGDDALAQQILEGLAAEQITATDVAHTEGVLALTIERGAYKGWVRAKLADGRITALACFANPRERAACESACRALRGAS
jgi:hypothetical protein